MFTKGCEKGVSLPSAKNEINNPFRKTGPTVMSLLAFTGKARKKHPMQPLYSQVEKCMYKIYILPFLKEKAINIHKTYMAIKI